MPLNKTLVRELVEKENSEFKPIKLRLKIGLASYAAQTGVGKYGYAIKQN